MTIHFVYPYDAGRIAAPWTIGNRVAEGLRARGYQVEQYDWEDRRTVRPRPGDVLLGHPHPADGFVFRNSHRAQDWRRVVVMSPWNGNPDVAARFTALADDLDPSDGVLAICGPYWAQRPPDVGECRFAAVDMAIDRAHFPRLVKFAEPGQRAIAYVGCCVPDKGTDYLAALSERLAAPVRHFGIGIVGGRVEEFGYWDWSSVAPGADFIIATGRHDANPTSLLEGASWGMLPICTPQSGWGDDVAIHVPLDDIDTAAATINRWLLAPTSECEARRAQVDAALSRYSWDSFVSKVVEAIE